VAGAGKATRQRGEHGGALEQLEQHADENDDLADPDEIAVAEGRLEQLVQAHPRGSAQHQGADEGADQHGEKSRAGGERQHQGDAQRRQRP
jgi:hypothetical protein